MYNMSIYGNCVSLLLQQADQVKSEEENKSQSLMDDPPDAFLMVTQQRWEDKVLYDVPYSPSPQMTGAGNERG